MTYELFCNFKTSYVMVYRQLLDESTIVQGNFKTSYVMVYLTTDFGISCISSISKHHMLWFIDGTLVYSKLIPYHFKTSYVMVYQAAEVSRQAAAERFQNIICYGLSSPPKRMESSDGISKHHMLWFIITSCTGEIQSYRISKHHMLWFIFFPAVPPAFAMNFKTSYVMVYRSGGKPALLCCCISKHHMLWFIYPQDY